MPRTHALYSRSYTIFVTLEQRRRRRQTPCLTRKTHGIVTSPFYHLPITNHSTFNREEAITQRALT